MYSYYRPTTAEIEHYLMQQSQQSISYPDVGASRHLVDSSDRNLSNCYNIDHNRLLLGSGSKLFEQAKIALKNWEMFRLDWVELLYPNSPIEVGSTVGIMIQQLGIWSINPCQIIYVFEEHGLTEKWGFAYSTLPDHGLCGEERFVVEWCRSEDTVWYDLLAFSRPNQWLTKIFPWYIRRLQKRFGADSLEAMKKAVSSIVT